MDYLSGWCRSQRRLEGLTAIVTGANGGIGKETTMDLYKRVHEINFEDINYRKTRYQPLEAYSKSKIANIMFAKALAQKLKEYNIEGVTTYSLHPGIVHTEIDRNFWSWIRLCFHSFLLRWMWKSARCGAQTSIHCAVDESCAEQSSLYYTDCTRFPPSAQCRNDRNAARLWDLTVEMLGLQDYNPFFVPDE